MPVLPIIFRPMSNNFEWVLPIAEKEGGKGLLVLLEQGRGAGWDARILDLDGDYCTWTFEPDCKWLLQPPGGMRLSLVDGPKLLAEKAKLVSMTGEPDDIGPHKLYRELLRRAGRSEDTESANLCLEFGTVLERISKQRLQPGMGPQI